MRNTYIVIHVPSFQLSFIFPIGFYLTTGGDRQKHEPESYCNELIEGLLLPVIEAATGVTAESAQLSFLMLTICIFLSEMRKAITANKKLYR